MPEGDTVYRTATRLDAAFAGHQLTRCDLRWPTLATYDLSGATTLEVVACGKHVLHRFDTGITLHSHLRMDGSWRLQPGQRPVPRRRELRAVLGTAHTTALGLSLGMLDLVRTPDEHTLIGHLGPDILHLDAPAARAVTTALGATHATLGEALLDQRMVAGFGTIWASESCFAARLNPLEPVNEIAPQRLASLLVWAQRAMRVSAGLTKAATPHQTQHGHANTFVYRKERRPCPRCGTPIQAALVGRAPYQRTLYFCPKCQPPTHNGEQRRQLAAKRCAYVPFSQA